MSSATSYETLNQAKIIAGSIDKGKVVGKLNNQRQTTFELLVTNMIVHIEIPNGTSLTEDDILRAVATPVIASRTRFFPNDNLVEWLRTWGFIALKDEQFLTLDQAGKALWMWNPK